MLQHERHEYILKKLVKENSVRTTELCTVLDTSRQTIFKDIELLAANGKLKKVHGGAILTKRTAEPSLRNRSEFNLTQKKAIAKRAAQFVENGDTIYLDFGTTINHMLKHLTHLLDLTIVTNSVDVAYTLGDYDNIHIILSGGEMRSKECSLSGILAYRNLENFYVDKGFFGIGGFTKNTGYTDYHMDEAEIRRLMVDHSSTSFALMDHTKFKTLAATQFVATDAIDVVITDEQAPKESMEHLRDLDVKVEVVT